MIAIHGFYDWVITTATAAGALGAWYFVVAYWVLTRGTWRRTGVGNHLMGFTGNLAMLLTLILVNRVLGLYPGRRAITAALFLTFVVQIFVQCVLLHMEQRKR